MALFRKFFYRKPPDGLLEISERVYVFDCCFTTDVAGEDAYKVYITSIVEQLRDHFPDASFMVFNFTEGECQSQISNILAEYELTVVDYPRQYEGCPLLTMQMIHHFLRSGESWLSSCQQNVLLMHCERGGWPVLAFMLAALLVYRKQYPGEQRTLDMIYKQAPRELLHLLSPLNPLPSQLRYLHYISRRNVGLEWPPLDRALTLDCVILRFIPDFDEMGGCRPIFRIYGPDPLIAIDRTPIVLFSTPKKRNLVRFYKQEDCELVKIDIHCHIQGDVVLECISLDEDLEREQMMFRVMFNTAFIRSNILMLDRDSIDIHWDAKDRFPKDFRVEVLLSEMDAGNLLESSDLTSGEEKEGLPIEAFEKVKEMFNLDWLELKPDTARFLQHIASSRSYRDSLDADSPMKSEVDAVLGELSPRVLHDEFMYGETNYGHRKLLSSSTKKHLFSTQSPSQIKIISQRIHVSRSTPAFSSKSLPGSHATVSRYYSAPSALGIMALLDDHTVSDIPEDTHATKLASSVAASSASGSSISSKLSHSLSSRPLSSNSASYTKEAELRRAHSLPPTSPPPPPLSPLIPPAKVASIAPPPPPLPRSAPAKEATLSPAAPLSSLSPAAPPPPPIASTAKTDLDAAHKQLSSPEPPSRSMKSSVPEAPLATKKLSDLVRHTLLLSQPSHHGNTTHVKVNLTSIPPPPPPPLPHKGTSLAPASAGLEQSASSPVIPSPPPPPSMTSLSSHTNLMPSRKVTGTVGVRPPPPPPPCPGPAAATSAPHPPPPPCPDPAAAASAPPPPPPPPCPDPAAATSTPPPPPPPCPDPAAATSAPPPPPPPPPCPDPAAETSAPPPPPPPPCPYPAAATSAPPPPPPPHISQINSGGFTAKSAPPPPVPPCTLRSLNNAHSSGGKGANCEVIPPPPPGGMSAPSLKGRLLRKNIQSSGRKTNLKPLHWVKVTRAVKGSLWAEPQTSDEFSKAPEFDMSELESLFSAAVPNSDHRGSGSKGGRSTGPKSDKVHLIDLRRANNCEIMLTKVKMPLNDLMSSVLALDDSILDGDQVDNLIKFCPTKEEMELLKGYNGDKENLGKCEQYFLELMKIPRVESKLRVFSFKIQFNSQFTDLKTNLNIVNSCAEEIRSSVKLKRIMQTILSLGNALNQGTARGAAVGFRLDSLLKLTDTRARNNKMTLMHYLCKVLAEKLPELLDFPKDLVSLEVAAKMQLKCLAEEMQAINKGLEKVEQELTTSENDGHVSQVFCQTLREFLAGAEAEVRSLTSLYSNVGRNADALALYFGEDPARCPFEQVVSTLVNFVRMFVRAHEENCKHIELEKKKALKEEAENEKAKAKQSKETTEE